MTEIHFILKSAYRRVGLAYDHQAKIDLPVRPLLIKIANMTSKGCNMYSKLLKKKVTASTSLAAREDKWSETLNCNFSVDFWKKVYSLTADIKFDNRYKWLQFQINRHSL